LDSLKIVLDILSYQAKLPDFSLYLFTCYIDILKLFKTLDEE